MRPRVRRGSASMAASSWCRATRRGRRDRARGRGAARCRGDGHVRRALARSPAPGDRGVDLRPRARHPVLRLAGAGRRAVSDRGRRGRAPADDPAGAGEGARGRGMSSAVRLRVFLISGAGLLAFLLWSYTGLPDFGHYLGPYGDILVRLSIPERSTTAVVSAINFDFRGFDTLGEEFILFAAVVGVTSL